MTTTQKHIQAHMVNGFIQNGAGGNPAGVVLDADNLTEDEKLAAAKAIGASETAFVSASGIAGFKLDFFTPTRRIAHCGHATIATFSYLAQLGRVKDGDTSKETIDGRRKVTLKGDTAYMEQLTPRYEGEAAWADKGVTQDAVLASLGMTEADLDDRAAPTLVNTGNSFILIGVKDGNTLASLTPDQDAITRISNALGLIGYYVFTTDPAATDKDATARMFAPAYGIAEESATGMAAGPLACFLWDRLGITKSALEIEQGHFMTPASPSIISVQLDVADGQITGLMAGGKGKAMRAIEVSL